MKFGFIGAGKVGFSLGKYFADHDLDVVGYYSEAKQDSREAAEFTNSKSYDSLDELVADKLIQVILPTRLFVTLVAFIRRRSFQG